jgi:tetratricopeptide (TPR) repeat protein
MDDPARAATSATEMAIVYRRRGRTGPATQLFTWAITQFAVAGHPPHEAQAHVGLGNLHLATGRLVEARQAYTRALALVRQHGNKAASLDPNIIGCLAEVLALEGHHRPALDRYNEAMARAAALGDRKQWAQLQFQVARVHQRSGDPVPTAQTARRAAQALDSVGLAALATRARQIATEAESATDAAPVGREFSRRPRLSTLGSGQP